MSGIDVQQSSAQESQSWNASLMVVHPEDRQLLIEATQAHFNHGTKYDVEFRALTTGGDIRWMRSAGQADRNAEGTPTFMRGIIQDVTERKYHESHITENEQRQHDGRQLRNQRMGARWCFITIAMPT